MTSPLISPEEAAELLAHHVDVVVLDARATAGAYEAGHLCDAIRVDLETELSSASTNGDPARGGRHPLPPLGGWLARVGAWGIEPETRVLVYDDQNGANAAARAWWMLRAIGHERVSVIDGGFDAARAAGIEVTTDAPRVDALPPYPSRGWQRATVDMDCVDEHRVDPRWKVLDVRSAARFGGKTEPIDPVAGHIPGAVNLPFAENLDAHGRFKPPAELRSMYASLLGDTPADRLVVHCGSGVTACHTLLALDAAGLTGASLYVGSWGEWCRNPMPVQRDEGTETRDEG